MAQMTQVNDMTPVGESQSVFVSLCTSGRFIKIDLGLPREDRDPQNPHAKACHLMCHQRNNFAIQKRVK